MTMKREPAGFQIVDETPRLGQSLRRVPVISNEDGVLIGYATVYRDSATVTLHIPVYPGRPVLDLAVGPVSIGYKPEGRLSIGSSAERPRITIDRVDVTEHVAALFDALAASLDWGSGFLDVETIESALILADLAGFEGADLGAPRELKLEPWNHDWNEPQPAYTLPHEDGEPIKRNPEWQRWLDRLRTREQAWHARRAEQIAAWREQVAAKARALAAGDSGRAE